MNMTALQICAILNVILLSSIKAAFPPSLRYPIPVAINKILDVNSTCDSNNLNVTITLQYPFKGVLFAKDFSQECKAFGIVSNTLSINLPTSGCGVRLSSKLDNYGNNVMYYSVTLVAQQDRYLRQIADQEKYVECSINENAFLVKSQPVAQILKNTLKEVENRNVRVGRNKKEDSSANKIEEKLNKALSEARAWMEIYPENEENRGSGILQVGEVAMLTIKSTLPVGIGWKVVDCTAHDGLGDTSQKLLDEEGCPVDEILLPIPRLGPIQPVSLMRHQEATARFAAFKFPDRDRLHLSCGLELCRGPCIMVECDNKTENSDLRSGRTLSKGEQGEILDKLTVFNSVEVIAPAIDDLRKSEKLQMSDSSTYPFTNLPGDRTFCVSPDKIAITFCILGVIFLCAVVVAACALYRARRNNSEGPFYTRSLFSSSSGGSAYGSKLLLHDSPCMGQSTSRGIQYGRIL